MYGINLNSQNLTGDFKGFAMTQPPFEETLNSNYEISIPIRQGEIVVLCGTRQYDHPDYMTSPLTPPGIALRGIRENEAIEIAANSQTHFPKIAIFSPTFRRKEAYGLEVYNDKGEIAYSSADTYLTPVATVELPFGKKAQDMRTGRDAPSRIDFPIPAGKRYGVVLGTWGTGSSALIGNNLARVSSHPIYRRHKFHYFGYYCTISYWDGGGNIGFWLGSSGLPPDEYIGRGHLPTATALIVDLGNL